MRSRRVDKNHKEIVEAYRAHGFSVADTSRCGDGFPDIVVGKHGVDYLVEIKSGEGKLKKTQEDFRDNWRGSYRVVRTLEDVQKHAKEILVDEISKGFVYGKPR